MGIEQEAPVAGSIIDLPPNIDLPDLRLPRAFRVWTDFRLIHFQQVASIGSLQPRAVAEIFQAIIPDSTLVIHDGLNCITYKDENDQPPTLAEELLKALPLGIMPWEPELVDRWCKAAKNGTKQSAAITEEIEGLVNLGIGQGNDLFLVLTHNQQLAEVLRVAGELQNPNIRFPELTMIVEGDRNNLTIFPRGVLSEVA